VVPCPERKADERKVALQGDPHDGGERAVSAGYSERFRSGIGRPAGDLGRIVVLAEDADVDSKATSLLGELLR
jgi:hypothetical protein